MNIFQSFWIDSQKSIQGIRTINKKSKDHSNELAFAYAFDFDWEKIKRPDADHLVKSEPMPNTITSCILGLCM